MNWKHPVCAKGWCPYHKCVCVCVCVLSLQSCPALQAPLSMAFSRQEYKSGLPLVLISSRASFWLRDRTLICLCLPALQADSLPTKPLGKPSQFNLYLIVTPVYGPRFFVSSQQRFGAMDIKALGASQLSGLGQIVLQLLGKSVLQLHFI